MNLILAFILTIPGILFATTIHEYTRAMVSTMQGDVLPKQNGRLTLNPFKHFEPVGFFLLLFSNGFGWGKPVETSSLYYKNRKKGTLITAIAPSVANLVFAVIFAYIYKVAQLSNLSSIITNIFYYALYINVGLAVYNIVPVSPMDGLKVMSQLIPANSYFKYLQYEKLVQMLFLFFLFLGPIDLIFRPLIEFVIFIIDILVFI